MSNFFYTIRVKATGELVKKVTALDNYFGSHLYGYTDGKKVYMEEEVEEIPTTEYEKGLAQATKDTKQILRNALRNALRNGDLESNIKKLIRNL